MDGGRTQGKPGSFYVKTSNFFQRYGTDRCIRLLTYTFYKPGETPVKSVPLLMVRLVLPFIGFGQEANTQQQAPPPMQQTSQGAPQPATAIPETKPAVPCVILKRMGPADEITSHLYSFGIRGKQFQYVEGNLPKGTSFHGRLTDHDARKILDKEVRYKSWSQSTLLPT